MNAESERYTSTSRSEFSSECGELFGALAKAQAEGLAALKDSKNPHFKSSFASLAACSRVAFEACSKNGLGVAQYGDSVDGHEVLWTHLGHSSGQWLRGYQRVHVDTKGKNPSQAYGSGQTYARRYGLCAMVGIAPEDDDGNASGSGNQGQHTVVQDDGPIEPGQKKYIDSTTFAMAGANKLDAMAFAKFLRETFGCEDSTQLTKSQAARVIDMLDKKKREIGASQ